MKITNLNKKNPLEIMFDLSLNKDLFLINEDFCLYLDLKISFEDKEEKYDNIVIDKSSLEGMISTIKTFINKKEKQLYYEPLEADFWIYIPCPPKSREDIIEELVDAGLKQDEIQEIIGVEDIHKLFFLVDTKKYKEGFPTGTGIAYCLDVTNSQLEQFANDLEKYYIHLLKH